MKLIKGCRQLITDGSNTRTVFTYADTGRDSWDVLLNGDIHKTGWDKPDLPGTDHRSFSNFVLWFEYEEAHD